MILNMLRALRQPSKLVKLHLSDFKKRKNISDDTWNHIKDGEVEINFLDGENQIGQISYRPQVGQIGNLVLNEKYRDRGLGKQILSEAIKDIKTYGTMEVWAVTRENHPFWDNVWNKSFQPRKPAHCTVTGSGYYLKI